MLIRDEPGQCIIAVLFTSLPLRALRGGIFPTGIGQNLLERWESPDRIFTIDFQNQLGTRKGNEKYQIRGTFPIGVTVSMNDPHSACESLGDTGEPFSDAPVQTQWVHHLDDCSERSL
jgi:hypothetical protein